MPRLGNVVSLPQEGQVMFYVFVINSFAIVRSSPSCTLGAYWCGQLDDAGIDDDAQGRLTYVGGEWLLDGNKTYVAFGFSGDACDPQQLFCAGGTTAGYGSDQAAAVRDAVANGGIHPQFMSTSYAVSTTAIGKTSEGVTTAPRIIPVEIQNLHGVLHLNVTRADEFSQDHEISLVLIRAIAQLLECNETWIQNVKVVANPQRRLKVLVTPSKPMRHDKLRRLGTLNAVTKSGVRVEFDVVIPPGGGPQQVTASVLADRFDQKSVKEATDLINSMLQSGAVGAENYEVEIVFKRIAVTPPPERAPASSASSAHSQFMTLMVTASASCIFCLTIIFFLYRRRTRLIQERKQEYMKQIDSMFSLSTMHLLYPPKAISMALKSELQDVLVRVLEQSRPSVLVLCSLGHRKEDVENVGPGLFYGAAVIKALCRYEIACGFAIPDCSDFDSACLEILSSPQTSCRLLLVLETRSLFTCEGCLDYIYHAQRNHRQVMRLRFEAEIAIEDMRWILMPSSKRRIEVESLLQSTLASPDDPDIVQSVPAFLETFALDLKRKLTALDAYVSMMPLHVLSASSNGTDVQENLTPGMPLALDLDAAGLLSKSITPPSMGLDAACPLTKITTPCRSPKLKDKKRKLKTRRTLSPHPTMSQRSDRVDQALPRERSERTHRTLSRERSERTDQTTLRERSERAGQTMSPREQSERIVGKQGVDQKPGFGMASCPAAPYH